MNATKVGLSILCRIGLHRFRPWAYNSVLNPLPIEICERPGCGVGRQFHITGAVFTFTAEQVAEMRAMKAEQDAARARDRPPDLRMVSS
jgi:hypothetical protein